MGTFERSAITMPVEGKKNVEKEKREGIALEDDWRSRVQIFYFV